jgi:O-antigen/teichoic acid export membrane protein
VSEAFSEPLPPAAGRLRTLFADSVVYGISAAALPVALILATPFVARTLGPEGFGAVDVLTTLVALIGIVAAAGMDSAAVRSYFDYSDAEGERRATVIRTAVVVVFGSSAAIALGAAAVGAAFAATAETSVTVAAVLVAVGLMPLTNSQLIARVSFLLTRRRTAYLAASLLNAALGAVAAVVLVRLGLGPAGYFCGLAIGALAALVFSLTAGGLLRGARWLERREARVMLRYGLPLVPAAAASWMIFAVDRTLIAALKGLDDAGRYGLAAKVTAPMLLVATAFATAWGPFVMRQTDERRVGLRVRALPVVAAAAGVVFLWLVLFGDRLVELLGGAEFAQADRAVPGIALGWLAWTMATVLQTELAVSRRTGVIALVTAAAAAVNVLLNLLLIPPFGFVGAAWATAAAFAFLAAAYAVYERRFAPAPHDGRALVGVALALAAASGALLTDAVGLRVAAAVAGTALLTVVIRFRRT